MGMTGTWAFLIMGAGRGSRLGGTPKQFRYLGDIPVWGWSLELARELGVDRIVLTIPEDETEKIDSDGKDFFIVPGGETRSLSVRNALMSTDADWVLIHDGARPFASETLCRKIMASVTRENGVIPVVPLTDAVKKRSISGKIENMDRDSIMAAQTPQAFHRKSLLEALKNYPDTALDEAEAWIASGRTIVTVEGERCNFKITTSEDWLMAQKMAIGDTVRTGVGFDIHPLVPGRPLILGGVPFLSALGLDGHSDADLICHALSDAILGACGLPDIGILFPASDEAYLGADSYGILKKTIELSVMNGWSVEWADIVLNAQLPRIGNRVTEIMDKLDKAWEDPRKRINVKVKSGESVGSVGEGKCMTCYAVATVKKISRLRKKPNPL